MGWSCIVAKGRCRSSGSAKSLFRFSVQCNRNLNELFDQPCCPSPQLQYQFQPMPSSPAPFFHSPPSGSNKSLQAWKVIEWEMGGKQKSQGTAPATPSTMDAAPQPKSGKPPDFKRINNYDCPSSLMLSNSYIRRQYFKKSSNITDLFNPVTLTETKRDYFPCYLPKNG